MWRSTAPFQHRTGAECPHKLCSSACGFHAASSKLFRIGHVLSFPEHCKDVKWFAKYTVAKACCCFSLIVYFMFILLGKPTELPTFHFRKRPQHTLFIFRRRSHKGIFSDNLQRQKKNLALNFWRTRSRQFTAKGVPQNKTTTRQYYVIIIIIWLFRLQ